MQREEITWEMTLKLFWAQMWRTVPFFIVVGGASVWMFKYITTEFLDVDPEIQSWMGAALGFYIGIILALWVIRLLLTNGFGKYNLLIVEKEQDDSTLRERR